MINLWNHQNSCLNFHFFQGIANYLYEECVRESRIPGYLKLANEQNGNVTKAIEELCNLEKNYAKRCLF